MFEMLASEYRMVIQDVLAFAICGAALIWGGAPERIVAATWLVLFEIAGRLYRGVFGAEGYQLLGVDWFLASTDLLAGAIWLTVAIYANRNYTLWIAAMQLLAMTAHLARGLVEAIAPVAYIFMVVAPGWFQLIFLGLGLTRHILRKRKYGTYRDWRIVPGRNDQFGEGDTGNPFASLLARTQSNWRDELK